MYQKQIKITEMKKYGQIAEKNITITPQIHNKLVDCFNERINTLGYRGKKIVEYQAEFFTGAICALDAVYGYEKSSISPLFFFSIMRGDIIKKIDLFNLLDFCENIILKNVTQHTIDTFLKDKDVSLYLIKNAKKK